MGDRRGGGPRWFIGRVTSTPRPRGRINDATHKEIIMNEPVNNSPGQTRALAFAAALALALGGLGACSAEIETPSTPGGEGSTGDRTQHPVDESHPQYLTAAVSTEGQSVRVTLESITTLPLEGEVAVRETSGRGPVTLPPVSFTLAPRERITLDIPVTDPELTAPSGVSVLEAHVSAKLSDGSRTTALARAVRAIKPALPLDQASEPNMALAEVTAAYVTEGVRDRSGSRDEAGGSGGALAVLPALTSAAVTVSNKRLCFDVTLGLTFTGVGEDFWKSSSTTTWPIGQRIDAKGPGASSFSTWWLDDQGCVTKNLASGTWVFRAMTQTQILFSGIFTLVDGRRKSDNAILYSEFGATLDTSTSQTVTYVAGLGTTAMHIVHRSLDQWKSQLTIRSFPRTIPVTLFDGDGTFANRDSIHISDSSLTDKWAVSHEVGHFIHFRETEKTGDDYHEDYSLLGVACAFDGHNWDTREYNSSANLEGFASFWSAIVFNKIEGSDCFFNSHGQVIPCEAASTAVPLRFMESVCADATPFTGHGVETDWQRLYWDLIKTNGGTPVPTIKEMLTMLRSATSFTRSNHFSRLQVASDLATTPDYLEARWDFYSATNGIDW